MGNVIFCLIFSPLLRLSPQWGKHCDFPHTPTPGPPRLRGQKKRTHTLKDMSGGWGGGQQEIWFITFQEHTGVILCVVSYGMSSSFGKKYFSMTTGTPTHPWNSLWLTFTLVVTMTRFDSLYVKLLPSLLCEHITTTCLPSFVSRSPFPSSFWRKTDCVTV